MVSTSTQTRVILSAEDRGVTKLMNKLGAQTDAFIDQFSKIGGVFAAALGSAGIGYGIKQALSVVEEMKMDINGIAVTLTDTVKGSSEDIAKAFRQNQKHAEAFFKVLRRQAAESISDFDQLQKAYTMVATRGMALTPTKESAKLLSNVVDRIRLATKGQAQDIQILQELRSLFNGSSRTTDALVQIFRNRDVNFIDTVRGLVGTGDAQKVFEYLNTLLADIDISEVISTSLSKQTGRIKTEVQVWAIEAFSPLYDALTQLASDTADAIGSGDSSIMKSVKEMADGLASVANRAGKALKEMRLGDNAKDGSRLIDVMGRTAPKLLAIALAAKTAAISFGLLAAAVKSSVVMMGTIPGMITVGVMGYTVAKDWAENGRLPDYGAGEKTDPWDEFKYGLDILLEMVKAIGKSLLGAVMQYLQSQLKVILEFIGGVIDMVREIIHYVKAGIDAIGNAFNINALKFDEFTERRRQLAADRESYKDVVIGNSRQLAGQLSRELYLAPEMERVKRQLIRYNELGDEASEKKIVELVSRYITTEFAGNAYAQNIVNADKPSDAGVYDFNMRWTMAGFVERMNAEGAAVEGALANLGSSLANAMDNSLINIEKRRNAEAYKPIPRNNAEDAANAVTNPRVAATDYAVTQKASMDVNKVIEKLVAELGRAENITEQYDAKRGAGMRSESVETRLFGASASSLPDTYKKYASMKEEIEAMVLELSSLSEEEKVVTTQLLDRLYADLAEMGKVAVKDLGVAVEEMRAKAVEAAQTYEFSRTADEYQNKIDNLQGTISGNGMEAELLERRAANLRTIAELERSINGSVETREEAEARCNRLAEEYKETARETMAFIARENDYLSEQARLIGENSLSGSFKAEINELNRTAESSGETMKGFWEDVASSMTSSMSDGFYNIFKGDLNSLKDVFENFCNSILRAWSDMIAQLAAKKAFAWLGNTLGLDGLFNTDAKANGGVFQGGFRAFASGGTVTRPTLGLVGEGRYNEAIVPLPDGRSIPVIQKGGGANVTVNITDNSGSSTTKDVSSRTDADGNTIIDVVIDAIAGNKRNFRNYLKSQVTA